MRAGKGIWRRYGVVVLGVMLPAAFYAAPGQAQMPGWYVGIEAGGNFLEDADAQTRIAGEGFTPADPGTCLLENLPLLGPILAQIICLFPTEPGDPTFDPDETVNTTFRFSDGGFIGGVFGYAGESGFRPELAVGYRRNSIKGFRNNDSGESFDISGRATALSLMGNLWYDLFLHQSRFAPYFGGGIGVGDVEWRDGGNKRSDTLFAFQLGAGLGFRITDRFTASLDYRYLDSGNPRFTDGPARTRTEYGAHTAGLSLRYLIAPGDPTDSDGDGVPDFRDRCPGTPEGAPVDRHGCPLDSDNDGVPDYLDECPNTPEGVSVDATGCPLDSDGDGVPDYRDRCPGTPAGAPVDQDGCPTDSDGDGVPDYLDQCPGTPPGTAVDARGCPLDLAAARRGDAPPCPFGPGPFPPGAPTDEWGCPLDSDGDGVPDYRDECPQTPAGLRVLPNGCALVGDRRLARPGEPADADGYAIERAQAFVLPGVNFEFDSDRLLPESRRILNEVALVLLDHPDVDVDVEGHTDNVGTAAYNLGLSERRSNVVRDYLVNRGVPRRQMTPVGYGLTMPIDSNDTEDGRANNRRVELRVR